MKKLLLVGAAMTAGALGLQNVSLGHGGTYRGPGDTVPPGGGGGGGGGGPATPGPAGPSTPGGSGPSTPGPAGPATPGGPGGGGNPTTGGGGESGPDLTVWQFWWGFNKDPYLNLKAHIHGGQAQTGSDEFYLGHGQTAGGKDNLKPSEDTIRNKVVPALIKALEHETNNDIVTACLVALAKIGDAKSEEGTSEFEKLITGRIADPVQEIRETAAVCLGILANPASIGLLTKLLDDDPEARKLLHEEAEVNYRTRAFAAYGLGLVGYGVENPVTRKEIVTTLWKTCQQPRMATRDVKVGAVIAMGLVPLDLAPEPADETKGKDEAVYDPNKTAPTTRQEQIRYLITFFQDGENKDRNFLVRAHAPRSIALLLEGGSAGMKEEAAQEFLQFVGNKNRTKGESEIRQSCTLALGQIGDLDEDKIDVDIRTALLESEDNADPQVKNFGMIALGQVGGRPGTGADPTAGTKQIRAYFQKSLVRGKSRLKPWVALGIGVMERALLDNNAAQDPTSLGALRTGFAEESAPSDVGAYAIALGIARVADAEEILLKKLESFSDNDARGSIAVGLGLMNAQSAIAPIQEVVKKSKYRPELLKDAAIALGLLGDKNVVTELTTMLKDEAKTLSTQAAIASALGFIGDARSIDPLVGMLEDTTLTDKARAFAAVALGIVADKEPLPWNSKISVDLNYRASTITLTSNSEGTGILDIL